MQWGRMDRVADQRRPWVPLRPVASLAVKAGLVELAELAASLVVRAEETLLSVAAGQLWWTVPHIEQSLLLPPEAAGLGHVRSDRKRVVTAVQ